MRVLDYEDLRAKGIRQGKCQLWRMVKAGEFPVPIKIGHRNGWPEHEIDAWIAERIAERDAGRAA